MAKTAPDPESFLPLTPAVFHILLSLIDSEKHGYGIMQSVTESTDGEVNMGPGTLYGTIKRLLKAALIEECEERPDPELDDERRRYYRITSLGQTVLGLESRRYQRLVKLARNHGLLKEMI